MAIAAQVVFGDIMSHHSEGSSFSSSFDDADSDYYAMLQDFKNTKYNSDRSLSSFVSDVTDPTYWLEDIPIRDTARENRMLSQVRFSLTPSGPSAMHSTSARPSDSHWLACGRKVTRASLSAKQSCYLFYLPRRHGQTGSATVYASCL